MALFSLKKISQEASTRQVYLRGVGCYNAGKVFSFRDEVEDDGEIVTAQVENNDRDDSYRVRIFFSPKGEAIEYSCSCAAYQNQEYGKACKHIVAAMVNKYYADMLSTLTPASRLGKSSPSASDQSDSEGLRMIRRYMTDTESRMSASAVPPEKRVRLIPTVRMNMPEMRLSFSVGIEREYVVKDITRFCRSVHSAETVAYGKQLSFLHHPDSFTPESRALLELLLSRESETTKTFSAVREIPLSPSATDAFFDLFVDQEVRMADASGVVRKVHFEERQPPLKVSIRRSADRGGFDLLCDPFRTVRGGETQYVCYGNSLYRCYGEYSAQMRPFLTTMQNADYRLYIAENDMSDFCAAVYPTLQRFTVLEAEHEQLQRYLPAEWHLKLYLDSPEEGVITARAEYTCGGKTGDLYGSDDSTGNLLEELRAKMTLERHFQTYQPETGLLLLRTDEDGLYDFLTVGLPALQAIAEVMVSAAMGNIRVISSPRVSVGVSIQQHLLDIDLETEQLDPSELARVLASYRQNKRYHRLKNGSFLSLAGTSLEGIAQIADVLNLSDAELETGHTQVPYSYVLYLDRLMRDYEQLEFRRDAHFRNMVKTVRNAEDGEDNPPKSLERVLRQYQKTGFRWLKTMERYGFGGILADDMGLGKTLQVIALLLDARERGNTLPSLVVCPASLVINWEKEIRRFAPDLTVQTVLGTAEQRAEILKKTAAYDVTVTSYDLLKRDIEQVAHREFRYVILDEAQYIKNHTTQNARAVKMLRAKQRFALTGTPMENRLSELWSIFDFLMPGYLFGYHRFRERYETPIVRGGDEQAAERLSRLIGPFILRRLKRDVLRELPEKTETVRYCVMAEEQRSLYVATAASLRADLAQQMGLAAGQERIAVLAALMRLRQLCCDPSLCYENYDGGSAKIESCMELLTEAVGAGHKVLLFSQFTSMLSILQKRLTEEGISYYLLQGSTPKEQRAAMAESFNTDDIRVFLISLKAGGTGLNLTGADVVIHFDPWWNVAAQNQATDRAHRIGQKNSVQVYKLIAKDSIEEKILLLQESKQELADQMIHRADGAISSMTSEQLLSLLDTE